MDQILTSPANFLLVDERCRADVSRSRAEVAVHLMGVVLDARMVSYHRLQGCPWRAPIGDARKFEDRDADFCDLARVVFPAFSRPVQLFALYREVVIVDTKRSRPLRLTHGLFVARRLVHEVCLVAIWLVHGLILITFRLVHGVV